MDRKHQQPATSPEQQEGNTWQPMGSVSWYCTRTKPCLAGARFSWQRSGILPFLPRLNRSRRGCRDAWLCWPCGLVAEDSLPRSVPSASRCLSSSRGLFVRGCSATVMSRRGGALVVFLTPPNLCSGEVAICDMPIRTKLEQAIEQVKQARQGGSANCMACMKSALAGRGIGRRGVFTYLEGKVVSDLLLLFWAPCLVFPPLTATGDILEQSISHPHPRIKASRALLGLDQGGSLTRFTSRFCIFAVSSLSPSRPSSAEQS